MAYATLRTFSNVKSSAITPRHPSVPNFNSVISAATLNPFRLSDQRPLSVLVQPFHNLADVLRAVPRANQQGVARFDNDDVFHSDRRYKLIRTPEEISIGIERRERPGGYVSPLCRASSSYTAAHDPMSLHPTSAGMTNTRLAPVSRVAGSM